MQRIGVVVCWCGSNIAATVDVAAVAQTLAKEPGWSMPQTINTCAPKRGRIL